MKKAKAMVIFLISLVFCLNISVFAQDSVNNSSGSEPQVAITGPSLNYLDDNTLNYHERVLTKGERDQNDKLRTEKEKQLKEFIAKGSKNLNGKATVNTLTALTYTPYWTYTPLYTQTTCYYCGPTTASEIIGNWLYYFPSQTSSVSNSTKYLWWWGGCCKDGNYNNTTSSNWQHPSSSTHTCYTSYTNQQVTLANIAGTTINGSDMYGVVSAINNYLSPSFYYATSITSTDQNSLKTFSKYDISNQHAIPYLVSTYYLSHYAGHATGHFIAGNRYDDYGSYSQDSIGIVDCNNDSSYNGMYNEPFNNVFNALYHHGGTNIAY